MAVIAILGIVTGLLYAYSDQGWKLFYQSYSRGLSQVKAKLAIKTISDELREANKERLAVSKGTSFGVPLPDDASDGTPYIYFTKPTSNKGTGDVTGYNYVLYYFAKPKENPLEYQNNLTKRKKLSEKEKYLTLKYIKFLNQSKVYTEDQSKAWPFFPPILELRKSRLPEDEEYIASLATMSGSNEVNNAQGQTVSPTKTASNTNGLLLDHFALLKEASRNIPISGNFAASSLTEPFSSTDTNIFLGQDYKKDKPVKIKIIIDQPTLFLGLMAAKSEFEIVVTPRN